MTQQNFSTLWLGVLLATSATAMGADAMHDVTGQWEFKTNIANQAGSPQFTFKLEGSKLQGQYIGQFGDANLQGTVDGDAIEFSFATNNGVAKYKGKILEKDRMSGEADYGSGNTGTWTAERSNGKRASVVEGERLIKLFPPAFNPADYAAFEKYTSECFAQGMLNQLTDARRQDLFKTLEDRSGGGLEYHSIQDTRLDQVTGLFKGKGGQWVAIRLTMTPSEPYRVIGLHFMPPKPPAEAASK